MDTLVKADIFFFISAIATVVLSILFIVALYYLIRILKDFSDISDTLKRGVDKASGHLDDLVYMLMNNPLFRFFFGKSSRRRSAKESEKTTKKGAKTS